MTITTHDELAWNCVEECAEGVTECGAVFVASSDIHGNFRAYGHCVTDCLSNPELYADETLHGTHMLSHEHLRDIYGDYRNSEHAEDYAHYAATLTTLTTGPDDQSPFLTIAVDRDDQSHLVTADVLRDYFENPDKYADTGFGFVGTHILPDGVIHRYFPEGER